MKKVLGHSFLHTHPYMSKAVDSNHVVVDGEDYSLLIDFFNKNKNIMERFHEFINTEKDDTFK